MEFGGGVDEELVDDVVDCGPDVVEPEETFPSTSSAYCWRICR